MRDRSGPRGGGRMRLFARVRFIEDLSSSFEASDDDGKDA